MTASPDTPRLALRMAPLLAAAVTMGCSPLIGMVARLTRSQGGGVELFTPVEGSTRGASDDHTLSCGAPGGAGDRVYIFVPDETGTYRVDLNAGYDAVLALLDAQGQPLACNDDHGPTTRSRVQARLVSGQRYQLVVDGYRDRTGDFTLVVEPISLEGPTERDRELPLRRAVRGDTRRAAPRRLAGCGSEPGAPDETFSFTAPRDGAYQFDLGAQFAAVVAIFERDATSPMVCDPTGSAGLARVTSRLHAGQTYRVVVDGQGVSAGSYRLRAREAQSTGGGVLTLSRLVSGDLSRTVFGNTAAGSDHVTPSCGSERGSPDETWTFTAPQTDMYRVRVDAHFNSVVAVLDDAGTEVGCNDDDATPRASEVQLSLTAGDTVRIVVDGHRGEAGAYQLRVQPMAAASTGRSSGACTSGASTSTGPPLTVENITAMQRRCRSAPPLTAGLLAGRLDPTVADARFSCGLSGAGGGAVYSVQVSVPTQLTVTARSTVSPVLELRAGCSRSHQTLSCVVNRHPPLTATVRATLAPGQTYYLLVDSVPRGDAVFTLDTTLTREAPPDP